MKRISLVAILVLAYALSVQAQSNFAERCLGVWTGSMDIYREGAVVNSVPARFTVEATKQVGVYVWRTEYLSKTQPMTKNYLLRVKDAAKGLYVTDEGGGLELSDYNHGNKLYSVFETGGILLTASYEIRGDELIFEVTSGKRIEGDKSGVVNYSVPNLQRVVYRREPKSTKAN